MRNINVVIGAGWGDEGKGLMTDYLTHKFSKSPTAVVRFNGGAQAGHGVELETGFRHVFHTLGSGTLNAATTVLSRHFVVNPIAFWLEVEDLTKSLEDAGIDRCLPSVYIDPRCIVTTPFEMEINQALERSRTKRHGSCGLGVGETVERESRGFKLTVQDIVNGNAKEILHQIEHEYYPARLDELGLEHVELDRTIIDNFCHDCVSLISCAIIHEDIHVIDMFENIVFEGAQGLCLDKNSSDFPHVTRSSTGLKNVMELLEECELDSPIDVYYVTRAYSTRHGAGPFVGEITDREVDVVDLTNQPNEFQGSMRYADLDVGRIAGEIVNDMANVLCHGITVNDFLVVTHCDQLPQVNTLLPEQIVNELASKSGIDRVLTSWGPTKKDIVDGCPITESVL